MTRVSVFPKLLAIAVFATALGLATSSFAVSFTGSVTLQSDAATDPALVVVTSPTLGTPSAPFSFDLANVGATHNIDGLFQIGTTECCFNWDDFADRAFTANFAFTAPEDFSGTVSGHTFGVIIGGLLQWNGPAILDFGNTGKLLISLSDAFFPLNFHDKGPFMMDVDAKFKLKAEDTTPIPLPAALPLFAGGLGGLGLLGWWRRRKRSEATY